MHFETIKAMVFGLLELNRADPEAAVCLLDWGRRALERFEEREKAQKERRKPCLMPIELRKPTLEELGLNVVGCSACRVTPKNKRCPGCGNRGVAPIRRGRKAKRKAAKHG